MKNSSGVFTIPYAAPPHLIATVIAFVEDGDQWVRILFDEPDGYMTASNVDDDLVFSFRREIAEHLIGVLEVASASARNLPSHGSAKHEQAQPVTPSVSVRKANRHQTGLVSVTVRSTSSTVRITRTSSQTDLYLSPALTTALCQVVVAELARIATRRANELK